jgi:hypothetical protein
MQYKPKNIGALHIALGGLPGHMRIEAGPGIGVSAKTVARVPVPRKSSIGTHL